MTMVAFQAVTLTRRDSSADSARAQSGTTETGKWDADETSG
jgi:hypothetical protein